MLPEQIVPGNINGTTRQRLCNQHRIRSRITPSSERSLRCLKEENHVCTHTPHPHSRHRCRRRARARPHRMLGRRRRFGHLGRWRRRTDDHRFRRGRSRGRMARSQREQHPGDLHEGRGLRAEVRARREPRSEVADRQLHDVRGRGRRPHPAVGDRGHRLGGLARVRQGGRDPRGAARPRHRARQHRPLRHPHRARQRRGLDIGRRVGGRRSSPTAPTTSRSRARRASRSSTSATRASTR